MAPPRKRQKKHRNKALSKGTPPQSRPASQRPKASLLGLPPELRNAIYRCTLVEDDPIIIDGSNQHQPAILRTCRKVRAEADSIYCKENTFILRIHDLHMALPGAHWMTRYITAGTHCTLKMNGSPNWKNLLSWLKREYEGSVIGIIPEDAHGFWKVVAQATGIVDELRTYCPWETIVKILEIFKASVVSNHVGFQWT